MTYETLVVETNSAGVAVLTLNRPGKLNALTDMMFTELHAAVQSLEIRDDVRVIILTGSGRGFCAGTRRARFRLPGLSAAHHHAAAGRRPVASSRPAGKGVLSLFPISHMHDTIS